MALALALRPRIVLPLAAVSVLTMPLTAIWFLLLGWLLVVATAAIAAVRRSPQAQATPLGTGLSIAVGLLAGPTAYLAMALASTA